MGLSANSLNRFRRRIDAALREFFPCQLVRNGTTFTASGPGGRAYSEFVEAGEDPEFRFPFRIATSQAPSGFHVGEALTWKISANESLAMEVADVARRPHEDAWTITCKHRRT